MNIDWGAKLITVFKTDTFMSLVTGTLYEMDTNAFRLALKDEEDGEVGIVFDDTHDHNTTYTVAGVTYARKFEIINGYQVEFDDTGGAWSCRLAGSNNNIFDVENGVLVQNTVQVIPGNSAGLIQITSGSGLDAAQDTKLSRIHELLDVIEGTLDHAEVMRILLAGMANKLSGADTGNPKFRDLADTKDRITATTDEHGNRTAVTLDVS